MICRIKELFKIIMEYLPDTRTDSNGEGMLLSLENEELYFFDLLEEDRGSFTDHTG